MLVTLGCLVLAAAWLGPLPTLARHSFAAHMSLHIAVVAIAAPVLAAGLARTAADPVLRWPRLLAPIPASIVELAVVWGWHLPVLHQAARSSTAVLLVEQLTFLASGLILWSASMGGQSVQNWRAGAGIGALLFTSIHMTLLGALFALAPRALYGHGDLFDQHLGGGIMLLVGGASYLIGGLWLTAVVLKPPPVASRTLETS